MRYLLLDRITALDPPDRATGIKCCALSEDYLADHFPGHPVMPGALLLEALAQLGGAPGANANDVGKYTVQWVFTRPNALSQVLESADAPSFALASGERLSLAGVSVEVKPKAA